MLYPLSFRFRWNLHRCLHPMKPQATRCWTDECRGLFGSVWVQAFSFFLGLLFELWKFHQGLVSFLWTLRWAHSSIRCHRRQSVRSYFAFLMWKEEWGRGRTSQCRPGRHSVKWVNIQKSPLNGNIHTAFLCHHRQEFLNLRGRWHLLSRERFLQEKLKRCKWLCLRSVSKQGVH